MIRQFRQLFARYADGKTRMTGHSQPLLQSDGTPIGQVDQVTLRDGRLVLDGWADAQRVLLSQNGLQMQVRPDLVREDVIAAYAGLRTPRPGFHISLPYRAGPVALALENGADVQVFSIPAFDMARVRRVRRRHLWSFLLRCVLTIPLAVRYKLTRDPTRSVLLRQGIKTRLRLMTDPVADQQLVMDTNLLAPGTTTAAAATPNQTPAGITIILPVYNAFDLVRDCVSRVVQHTDVPWHLIVIEDCSTDAAVRPWLAEWVAKTNAETPGCVTLIENPENRGFIRSVNSGFDIAITRGDHVVLLNSDALVPQGWASRLVRPLQTLDNAASVTPMSNDAEIYGAPVMCVPVALRPGEADEIDRTAATFDADASIVEAPTGVGFCMAMHIDYLRRFPAFDTAFGRGYGEEVDWCQKVRTSAGRNLGIGNLYVEHRGGQSFGNAEKMKSIAAASRIIAERYEEYDADVQTFVRHDPLHTPRLALALAWATARTGAQGHALTVYMAHAMGGGAEHYLQRRIAKDFAQAEKTQGKTGTDVAVILRMGTASRFQLEVYTPAGVTTGSTNDFAFVQSLLAPAKALHIVYSNGVGDPDPVVLPQFLLGLKRGDHDSIEILFHDFFPLSPSFNLLSARDQFEGVPNASTRSPVHETRRPDGTTIKLAEWRAAWAPVMKAADEVRVFSNDGVAHVVAAYPEVTPVVVPHTLDKLPKRVTAPTGKAPVIGVLGNIGMPKGAPVLKGLGAHVSRNGLVVIGNVDPAYDLGPHTIVHGDYMPDDITMLAEKYNISCWLIPSICPETFSYTTQECLATGLPVWCFDLGAQAEAVRRSLKDGAGGGILPLKWTGQPAQIITALTT